jgi:ABC-type lipoprotein export system ATPase subunit
VTVTAPATDRATLAACDSVTVAYGAGEARVKALDGVSLSVSPGDRLALWGPSGSGKTTVLHALGGLVTPSSGSVLWRGEPLSSLDAAARGRARAGGIAYVFQGANLLPHFTAFENVAFALRASGEDGGPVDRDPEELLGLVGLADKLDSLPSELSGGEAQRVAIARALGQRPELLLCDEPTGHLDSDTGGRVLDLIDALHAEFGFALVLATHDADVAARADRMVTLVDGHVVVEESFR